MQKDGKMHHAIYEVNLGTAQDITDMKLNSGKDLEYGDSNDLKKVKFLDKKEIVNLTNYEWPHEKLEGIAYIDPYHIALSNDNDFGFTIDYIGGDDQIKENYSINHSNKQLLYKGNATKTKIGYKATYAKSEIWMLKLANPL
jgi:hypothetical protein